MRSRARGFTLIELLLVVALLGIITGIAIPYFGGQRQRARRIGDAESNARILAMGLESAKAETGVYGPVNAHATWSPSSSAPTTLSGFTSNPVPSFSPPGNTQMTFDLNLPTALTYVIDVYDGGLTGKKVVSFTQTGGKTVYN